MKEDERGYLRGNPEHSDLISRQIAFEKIYQPNRNKYPLPFTKYVVHHKDRDKLNNSQRNLDIVTPKEHNKIHYLGIIGKEELDKLRRGIENKSLIPTNKVSKKARKRVIKDNESKKNEGRKKKKAKKIMIVILSICILIILIISLIFFNYKPHLSWNEKRFLISIYQKYPLAPTSKEWEKKEAINEHIKEICQYYCEKNNQFYYQSGEGMSGNELKVDCLCSLSKVSNASLSYYIIP